MELVIQLLDLAGTTVFAITGALAAGRKRMDVFGVIVLAFVTAVGGGTLRDIILGSRPVFWIADTSYLTIAVLSALATFVLAQRMKIPSKALLYADAIGLAVFTAIGFEKGFQLTGMYSIGIVMGITTAVVGGIIRDVLSDEVPLIFRQEIYASAALGGAAVFALCHSLGLPHSLTVVGAIVATFGIRLIGLHKDLTLPQLKLD